MAKKETKNDSNIQSRQSRKEILRERKLAEQQRVVRIAAFSVAGVLLLILLVAIVNEVFIAPNRAVAVVNGEEITLNDWQDRVRFERAQRIIALEDQLESFNNDIGLVQQFSNQAIVELINENAEPFGEAILDRMVDEEIIRQGAEVRGLLPNETDVDEQIGTIFNYFGGDSPTSTPLPTETIEPTPSITPIPQEGEDGPEGSEQTPGESEDLPTSTPFPTPTPVSEEAFQEEFNELMAQYEVLGVGEVVYRRVIENAIMADRMIDALADEENLPESDLHTSFLYLVSNELEQAEEIAEEIESSDFLTVWNTFRSQIPDPESEEPQVTASELLWRTRDSIEGGFGLDVADAAFELPLETPSEVIALEGDQPVYVIIMVNGREERPLEPAEFESRKQALLQDFVANGQLGDIVINELWRSRVPNSPVLDPKFRQPPTPAPSPQPEEGIDLQPIEPSDDQSP